MATQTSTVAQPREYEDRLIDAVHRQVLVLLLLEPDGAQRGALRAYAAADRSPDQDLDVHESEVGALAMETAQRPDGASRLAARAVVGAYIDRIIALTPAPPDTTPPTRVERDVCIFCRRPIERTDVRPRWRHLEGRVGSAFCASPLDSTIATPQTTILGGCSTQRR